MAGGEAGGYSRRRLDGDRERPTGVRAGVASGSDRHNHSRRRREEHPKVVETGRCTSAADVILLRSPGCANPGCAPLMPRLTSIRRPSSMPPPPPPPPTGLPHARDHEPNRTRLRGARINDIYAYETHAACVRTVCLASAVASLSIRVRHY